MKENIFAIRSRGLSVGFGFLANGYFITAAHVITDYSPCIVIIDGKIIELSKEVPIFIEAGDVYDPENIDLAYYKLNIGKSGFDVSDYIPYKNELLESYCLRDAKKNDSNNPIYESDIQPAYALGEVEGNYFHCKCKRYEGSSGSPLIKDNKVIGIMHGGMIVKDLISNGKLSDEEKRILNLKDDDIICSFLSIKAFMTLINENE